MAASETGEGGRVSESTSRRGARGAFATLVGQSVKVGMQLVSLAILGRLLSPSDFGLAAMVTIFATFGGQIRDFGIPTAALQAETLSRQQASNLFWINSGLGAASGLALWVTAPLLVEVYGEPRLVNVVPFSALAIVLSGLQAQQQIQMVRELRFVAVASTEIASQFIALLVAISGAVLGVGYLALAWQALAGPMALFVLRSFVARFLPMRPRRDGATLPLVKSGLYIGGAQLLTLVSRSVDTLTVGVRWGAAATGYYDRAYTLAMQIPSNVVAPLMNVVVPTMNRMRAEGADINRALLRTQGLLSALGVWLMLLAASTSPWLIPLVLGNQWNESIGLFQWLSFAGGIVFCSAACYWAFLLHNRARLLLWNDIVAKSVFVVLVVLAGLVSVEAVAIAYAVSAILGWLVNLMFLRHIDEFPSAALLGVGLRCLWAGGLAFGVVVAAAEGLGQMAPAYAIVVAVVLASSCYFLLFVCTPGGRCALRDVVGALRTFFVADD